jgi:N-acyl-D-amino-acid deacylase
MDDLLFRGGMILDGTGTDAVPADLAVRGGRITAITPHHAGPARRVVDPRGIGTVVVNGVVVVDSGEHTGALPGRVLRRGPAGVA